MVYTCQSLTKLSSFYSFNFTTSFLHSCKQWNNLWLFTFFYISSPLTCSFHSCILFHLLSFTFNLFQIIGESWWYWMNFTKLSSFPFPSSFIYLFLKKFVILFIFIHLLSLSIFSSHWINFFPFFNIGVSLVLWRIHKTFIFSLSPISYPSKKVLSLFRLPSPPTLFTLQLFTL